MSTINVHVKSSSDKKFIVAIETDKTVLDLKNLIAEQTEVPAERQRLIYSGRVLKDNDTLNECKIADGNTVHMVKGSQPGAPKRKFFLSLSFFFRIIYFSIGFYSCCSNNYTYYTYYYYYYYNSSSSK